MQSNAKWVGWAAPAVLSILVAAPALAGSVTQPGDTMGSPSGAPIPPGFYLANQTNYGCVNATPRPCVFVNVPLVAWATSWKIVGGQVAFAAAPATYTNVDIKDVDHVTGLFNPFLGTKVAWELGDGWYFAYLLGVYFKHDSRVAYSSASLNQRFGLTYLANDWDLTANVIWGTNFDQVTDKPQGFPCPTAPTSGCNPHFVNLDLTATKRFGKWEGGLIGFYATDVSQPIPSYAKQTKAAMGGLAGYWFGPVILQLYVTSEVYERNYGGKDTRGWMRVVIPLPTHPALPF